MTTAAPSLRNLVWYVFANYANEKQRDFAENAWRERFQGYAIEVFEWLGVLRPLLGRGSAGQGRWAEIPWIGLRHPSITDSFKDGVYVVYLYPSDLSGVYLSLNQGVTAVKDAEGFRSACGTLRRKAEELRATLDMATFLQDGNDRIALKAEGENGLLYEAGHICGLYYPRTSRISTRLEQDLAGMLQLYSQVVQALKPATPEAKSATYRSSLQAETDEFLERAALDITTGVQSGTETSPTLVHRRKRQQALRKALLRAYEAECAACGLSFGKAGKYMLHAAHVIDVEDHGASVVRNGLLLCPHHHWTLDVGCWLITEDYRVEVHPTCMEYPFLADIHGRSLATPRDPKYRVELKAISVRREKWRNGPRDSVAVPEDDLVLLELP